MVKEDGGKTIGCAHKAISSHVIVTKFTGNQENYTPIYVISSVREVLGTINLDPASCDRAQEVIQAEEYFTEEDNGLEKPWYGNVFLNPPYQMPKIRQFTDKLIKELPNIGSAILLTNNNTDTLWFHKCAAKASCVCLTKGRIHFYTETNNKTQPTNGQAFFYFGSDGGAFRKIFKQYGMIIKVML